MIDFDLFIKDFVKRNPSLEKHTTYIVNKFISLFGDGDFDDQKKICDLFVTSKNTVMQKSIFFRYKNVVTALYKWLHENGSASTETCEFIELLSPDQIITDDLILTTYYRDIDSCLNFIESIGKLNRLGNEDDLLPIKAISIVSWHGLSFDELRELKKVDILKVENYIVNDEGNIELELSEREYRILKTYAQVDYTRSFWAGQRVQYLDSKYLFRSARSEQFTKDSIKTMMLKFNDRAFNLTYHSIFLTSLATNGHFYSLLSRHNNRDISLQMFMNEFKCNAQTAWWYKALYKKWIDVYYPERGGFV